VNVPLAYLFSWPFTLVSERLFSAHVPARLLADEPARAPGAARQRAHMASDAEGHPKPPKKDSLLKDLLSPACIR